MIPRLDGIILQKSRKNELDRDFLIRKRLRPIENLVALSHAVDPERIRAEQSFDIGFAVGTTHVNSRVSTAEDPLGSEYAFELYYTFRPRPGLLIRPNLQYIHHPGGTSENEDVIALGLKTSASF